MNTLLLKYKTALLLALAIGIPCACASNLVLDRGEVFLPREIDVNGRFNLADIDYLLVAARDFVKTNRNPTKFTATIISEDETIRIGFSRTEIEFDPRYPEQMTIHPNTTKYGQPFEYKFQRGNLKFTKHFPR